ncbi:MAG: hypothetical protein KGJ86_20125, partial [Chloroflexota bacterium]|nr:hypothetical protein [Chloroflexota bacterium]
SLSSAEWVEEAPSVGQDILPLHAFGSITFTRASARRDGKTVTLAQAGAAPIIMTDRNHQTLAMPSVLMEGGTGFAVSGSRP